MNNTVAPRQRTEPAGDDHSLTGSDLGLPTANRHVADVRQHSPTGGTTPSVWSMSVALPGLRALTLRARLCACMAGMG